MINWYFIITCISQILVVITFPPIVRVGMPYSILISSVLIMATIYILWSQSYDSTPLFPPLQDLIDAEGGGTIGKKIIHVWMVVAFHLTWLFMYYRDWWHMTDHQWLFLYVNTIIVFYCGEKARKINTESRL